MSERIDIEPVPTIGWRDDAVVLLDQRRLPHAEVALRVESVDELVEAIQTLAIRGAPALGIAGAFGVALIARTGAAEDVVRRESERVAGARPTAVNLRHGVERALSALPGGAGAVRAVAERMLEEETRANRAASERAADFLLAACPGGRLRVLTHCNTGRLATGGWGTALGAVRSLAERNAIGEVIATETRPLLQGARLTTWELRELGVPHRLCVDSAAAALMAAGRLDCVVVGADRIAANGDVANKIGTYALALAAHQHRLPFVVVAPESTVDEACPTGAEIEIEERAADEVRRFAGSAVTESDTRVCNPAFDVTPGRLVSAVLTERRDVLTG